MNPEAETRMHVAVDGDSRAHVVRESARSGPFSCGTPQFSIHYETKMEDI